MIMKKSILPLPFVGPMAVAIVGIKDEERINFATHGMFGKMSWDPPLIYISALKDNMTARIINKTKKFSINIANAELLEKVKYCGSVSGMKRDKSKEFDVFYGEIDVPMISRSPVNMSCKLYQTIETNDMFIFIGKVIEAFSDEEYLLEYYPDVSKIDPLICTEQGEFYRLGNEIV